MLETRSTSGFPLSIGTSLSFETLFDPIVPVYDEGRVVPPKKSLNDYNTFLVNIHTLIRNILSSVQSSLITDLHMKELMDVLIEEMDFMKSFINIHTSTEVIFYASTYKMVHRNYDKMKGKIRFATTAKQRLLEILTTKVTPKIVQERDVEVYDSFLPGNRKSSALIFTHIPFDLLSYDKFLNLELLESHTGLIKTRKDWNSKYHQIPNKDMSFLPFMEYLLVHFGDHVMFHPDPLKDRLALYETLVKKRVHPLMSEFSLEFILK